MIELRHVTMSYGSDHPTPVLNDVSLHLRPGEFVLVCGASGCGKTSLLWLLNGVARYFFDAQISGDVLLEGRDVAAVPPHDLARTIGSVFQNPKSQFFTTQVDSELAFGCENLGIEASEIERRVAAVAQQFGLANLVDRPLAELSGGQKQRVACASVAAMKPQVLLLDEPSSNLDLAAIADLQTIMRRWKAQGRTVLVAEHRLAYVAELIDRVIYLDHGRIAEEFSGDQFRALSDAELARLGLRSTRAVPGRDREPAPGSGGLVVDSLRFRYPHASAPALETEHLELPAGSVIGVVGRNGAGKTTFVRALTGLEAKAQGHVFVHDADLSRPRRRLRRCYLVFQDVNHQLFGESVDVDVTIGTDHQGDDPQVTQILTSLHLDDKRDRHPMSLSGGERQRVAIAGALLSGRDLLVFDEPTSGLDLRHMHQVAEQLDDLAAQGKTVLVVTHDIELLARCCDVVVRIADGHVTSAQPCTDDVLAHTVHHLTARPAPSADEFTPREPDG